jgi:hypothetical protein
MIQQNSKDERANLDVTAQQKPLLQSLSAADGAGSRHSEERSDEESLFD